MRMSGVGSRGEGQRKGKVAGVLVSGSSRFAARVLQRKRVAGLFVC